MCVFSLFSPFGLPVELLQCTQITKFVPVLTAAGLKTKRGFCMLCALRDMAEKQHWTKAAYQPKEVHSNLGRECGSLPIHVCDVCDVRDAHASPELKKGFNKNRQEDTHEFFRFVTDALQATALAGLPK
jgi:ubiquitin carboxyl-terminal hydrolase 36/42